MNLYLVAIGSLEDFKGQHKDYSMIIIAKDNAHAEQLARNTSDDFKNSNNITITEIPMDIGTVVSIHNSN